MPSVKYFVFAVDRHLIHLSVRKVKAIQEVPEPQSASELQSLWELVNYYRKINSQNVIHCPPVESLVDV